MGDFLRAQAGRPGPLKASPPASCEPCQHSLQRPKPRAAGRSTFRREKLMIDSARLRREADFVLKHLRGPDDVRALAAARRFSRLPELSGLAPKELQRRACNVKRSHALDLVAIEHGFGSWSEVARTTNGMTRGAPEVPQSKTQRGGRRRPPKPPTPEDLARRVADRVVYLAEPLSSHCGGGHRLDVQRVREEALAAIMDALRGDQITDDQRMEAAR